MRVLSGLLAVSFVRQVACSVSCADIEVNWDVSRNSANFIMGMTTGGTYIYDFSSYVPWPHDLTFTPVP